MVAVRPKPARHGDVSRAGDGTLGFPHSPHFHGNWPTVRVPSPFCSFYLLYSTTLLAGARAAFGAARSDDVKTAPGEVILHAHDASLRIERVVRVVVVVGHRRVIVVVEFHLVERVKTLHHLFAPFSTHQTKIDERAIEIRVVDEIPREGHRGVEVGHRVRGAARDE